ncbi:hypothetical protein N1F78_03225 [Seonamhaeicola sp. MEBiC1930]|uniref:hypothetical protein n=1 Tax=Seonamhaeicola sp. MEBiC01930 TaxID=2976768 RepID=UPI0032447284
MFKQRKHKRFNYQPRFSKDHQLEKGEEGESESKEFVSRWRRQSGNKMKYKGILPVRTLILALVLLLLCMYLLEKKYM